MESIMKIIISLFGIGIFTGIVSICLKPEYLLLKFFPAIIVMLISFFFFVSFLLLSF
ncbi:hypothetical protein BvCmsKSP066_04261 [Escherichia coli]|nr:hypothetical protein BvCmsKSP076_05129 [Escherichia coli]GDO20542.1 hypothetical protein BvCmsKSP066_04261 [Escherichia coli]